MSEWPYRGRDGTLYGPGDVIPESEWQAAEDERERRAALFPDLLAALVGIVDNAGCEDVAGKYRVWDIPEAYMAQARAAIARARP